MRDTREAGPFGLTTPQIERYARHLILPEVGGRGQRALLDGCVRLGGDDDAAEEAALFLAAAGVGTLCISGRLAARVGARLAALNPDVVVAVADDAGAETGPIAASEAHVVDALGPSRLSGAMAALKALCAMVGAGPAGHWDDGLVTALATDTPPAA